MAAIRAVNPAARLIQTEDLGRTYATPRLRRSGRRSTMPRRWTELGPAVRPGRPRAHPLWERLIARSAWRTGCAAIADDPCPPDVIGVNHYLTSDRFLDHRCERYPPRPHGGNEPHGATPMSRRCACSQPAPAGWTARCDEAWARYGLPLAVTEMPQRLHPRGADALDGRGLGHGGARCAARAIDVRAVTAWSLLGSHDWNSLLTRADRPSTSPACSTSRRGTPRPTALAALCARLPGGAPRHPVTAGAGWWRRASA